MTDNTVLEHLLRVLTRLHSSGEPPYFTHSHGLGIIYFTLSSDGSIAVCPDGLFGMTPAPLNRVQFAVDSWQEEAQMSPSVCPLFQCSSMLLVCST